MLKATDIAAIAKGFAPAVAEAIATATQPLLARIAELEKQQQGIRAEVQADLERFMRGFAEGMKHGMSRGGDDAAG